MKYTLFCRPGKLFTPDIHYLYLGEWILKKDGYIILQHGTITNDKLHEILLTGLCSVFSDNRYHVLTVEHFYNEKYYHRIIADEDLQNYCGSLVRIRSRLFVGRLIIV